MAILAMLISGIFFKKRKAKGDKMKNKKIPAGIGVSQVKPSGCFFTNLALPSPYLTCCLNKEKKDPLG